MDSIEHFTERVAICKQRWLGLDILKRKDALRMAVDTFEKSLNLCWGGPTAGTMARISDFEEIPAKLYDLLMRNPNVMGQ
jgi:hypothetical protein